MRRALFLIVLAGSALLADAEPWRKLTSPHFELYNTETPRPAEQVMESLEQVRYTFRTILGSSAETRLPIRVLLFRDRRQFEEYAPRKTAAAFLLRYAGTRLHRTQLPSSRHTTRRRP